MYILNVRYQVHKVSPQNLQIVFAASRFEPV